MFQLWNIVLILFAALILAALIDPFASWFASKKIPRGLAVLLVYVVLIGLLSLSVMLLAPVIVNDMPQLVQKIQVLVSEAQQMPRVQSIVDQLQTIGISINSVSEAQQSQNLSNIFGAINNVFEGIAGLILILVIAFYMITEEDSLQKIVESIIPKERGPYIVSLLKRIRDKLAFWIRGQLVLSILVGVLTYLGLSLIGVKYAAALALIAALLEFIPYLGPTLATIPAFIIAFTQGGLVLAILALAISIFIQQLENHVFVPKIMQKAVGLNPIVSIIAIIVGAKLAGVLGAILAIPIATTLSVILDDVLKQADSSKSIK